MKYFVELTDVEYGVDLGRTYPIYWNAIRHELCVNFPRESRRLRMLRHWEDETGYVVEL